MERLGESYEFGTQLLRLLELGGWKIERRQALGGAVGVIASKNGHEVSHCGSTLAEAAYPVFEEATRVQKLGTTSATQLELA